MPETIIFLGQQAKRGALGILKLLLLPTVLGFFFGIVSPYAAAAVFCFALVSLTWVCWREGIQIF